MSFGAKAEVARLKEKLAVEQTSFTLEIDQLKEALEIALDWMEQSHYKCDLLDNDYCRAEEYGDGSKAQHEFIRQARSLLEKE